MPMFKVVITVADGQTETLTVFAIDAWKARTVAMMRQKTLKLRGQSVEYTVTEDEN
jgi:hypothetical protein